MTTGERRFVCGLPPPGWQCSRDHNHEGPCAATQIPGRDLKSKHIQLESYTDPQPAFYLYKEQSEAGRKWMKDHDKEKHIPAGQTHRYAGAIGGAYTWTFTGTSLGQVVKLECACGESIDVSDYDSW